jgi:hypothetical protein
MIPELRAAADRLMHTGGYLAYLAAEMRPKERERHCRATGLTVRQTFGHIVQWLEQEADTLDRYLGGEPVFDAPFDEHVINAGFAERSRETPLAELLARYNRGCGRMCAVYERVTPEMAAASVGDKTVGDLALQWTAHFQHHAVDFAEALPRLRFDPLLLDWALSPISADEAESARQLKLIEAARAYFKSQEESDDS